jgi:hypothetical protein
MLEIGSFSEEEKKMSANSYEVLSPWAEAEPVVLKGLAPRLNDLKGKKIGLLRNNKRAAEPILVLAARKLKERFPDAEFSWFRGTTFSASELEVGGRERLVDWLKGVDAVVAAVGD